MYVEHQKKSPVAAPAPGARLNLNCAGDTQVLCMRLIEEPGFLAGKEHRSLEAENFCNEVKFGWQIKEVG